MVSPFFNTLSSFVMAFLPRSRHLLISWLQSTLAVILEHQKIKSATVSTGSPSICHEVMGPDAMILVFLGSKTTADGDCSHEIKRCLLLGRKAMTNLDSVLKSRHHFADKGPDSQSYGSSMYGCESWTIKADG